ncbi:hypothetical protein OFO01_07395 [Campylobacter sp. JMF_01 NE2]|uniref:hypothetical protein n=1 Tax=unclassified Campylobacter TaxID=2593542 RepID=UPI0022E9F5E4|nr:MULTISPECIES: hypothetical protein [unclassified Campylobacter]MDA3053211.1 hypothetical protein [Campylobacter sp. JMF_03 NE3]MDA3067606.1 hypothetical protein [Campylobacter sp. JMF_01 NE2]
MKEILLEVLKDFKNADFSRRKNIENYVLNEKIDDKRNSEFFLREKDYNFFVNANANFFIDHDKRGLMMSFSAYDKLGYPIASLLENYEYIGWADLQNFSDKDLEKLASDWRISIENWKERALTKYKELYGK